MVGYKEFRWPSYSYLFFFIRDVVTLRVEKNKNKFKDQMSIFRSYTVLKHFQLNTAASTNRYCSLLYHFKG